MFARQSTRMLFGALALASLCATSAARADERALEEARKLFAEALNDEQRGDFAHALEKFERVRAVKETAAVEFRIATCHKGLGHAKTARDRFAHARALAGDDPKQKDIAEASKERLALIEPLISHVVLHPPAVEELTITLDGAPTPATSTPIELDSGPHVVHAEAKGYVTFESKFELAPAATQTIDITMARDSETVASDAAASRKRIGMISLAAGSGLVVVSAILLIVRQGEIGTVNDACPNDRCPESRRAEVSSATSTAKTEGVFAGITGVLGLAGVGTGLYFLLHKDNAPKVAPASEPTSARGFVVPQFAIDRDRAFFGATGTF